MANCADHVEPGGIDAPPELQRQFGQVTGIGEAVGERHVEHLRELCGVWRLPHGTEERCPAEQRD